MFKEGAANVKKANASCRYPVAVLVPCYNEEMTIAKVVADFTAALPDATIFVYDNRSTDNTAVIARAAGAIIRYETYQGKGYVVRRMFNEVEADIYVLVDGDATYDASSAPAMIAKLVNERLDMVVAARVGHEGDEYRQGHRAGNWLLTRLVAHIFGNVFSDILSGYRVFSRRFVKSIPVLSGGFEIETELTVHALELHLPVGEVASRYYSRPSGSSSKLSTWSDGFRIMWTVFNLYRTERPFPFFAILALVLGIISIGLAIPVFITYLEQGLVPRFPTAILAASLMVLASLSIACGLVLDTVTRARRELKLLAYMALSAPGDDQ
jgi:glycosyltransferase involved in cell wall biosynthesis